MRAAVRPQDPAEKWEIRFTEAEGGPYFRAERASHPYTPRREEDIPAGARKALDEVCSIHELGQIFIIPWAVRSIGSLAQKVISPNSVLALGERAVGLWTEKPPTGCKDHDPAGKGGRDRGCGYSPLWPPELCPLWRSFDDQVQHGGSSGNGAGAPGSAQEAGGSPPTAASR